MNEMIKVEMTTDKSLEKTDLYKKIEETINILFKTTGVEFFYGNCVASCDILQNILSEVGIKSKILECQALIIKKENQESKQFFLIGYDANQAAPNQVDTHTVLLIENANPIIIDPSIGHIFQPKNRILVEYANGSLGSIAEYCIDGVKIIYKKKESLKLPSIHQKNLIQRIISEQNTEKTIVFLRKLILCAVALGVINFTLNILLIILRLYNVTWVE